MNGNIVGLLIPTIGLVSGLVATYVSLQNRALLAEVRKELAELENRIITRLNNGTFVRASECHLRESHLRERVDTLAEELRKRNAAGS